MSWFEGMTTRLLQALAACLTVLVYLLRRHCVLARCPVKCSSYGISAPNSRDPRRSRAAALVTLAAVSHSNRSCIGGCSSTLLGPRCKQDPVIKDFTVPPLE